MAYDIRIIAGLLLLNVNQSSARSFDMQVKLLIVLMQIRL